MASLPLSRGSTYSSSDSDDSDADSAMLAQCSLQEISQEDLAVILPEQQECDAFGDFECNRTDKNSPQTGELSGSDMELPQQAVNALIQRTTESSSESESHAPPPPSSLYANSLLQQFVAQTQMLNTTTTIPASDGANKSTGNANAGDNGSTKTEVESTKKRRGRPKKVDKALEAKEKALSSDYCANPNVSPDSGIQNSPDHVSSPEPQLSPNIKMKAKEDMKKLSTNDKAKSQRCDKSGKSVTNVFNKSLPSVSKSKDLNKLPVTSNRFDRVLYANTDRVLYPPRRKVGRPPIVKKGPGRPPKNKPQVESQQENKQQEKASDKSKLLKTKHNKNNKPVLTTKNKLDVMKNKGIVLKNAKLMHSKHKKHKHKKYKFKILKPIGVVDPKINIEIEKLIADFVKHCVIGSIKTRENLPDIIKTMKKVSKKRKTTEYNEKKKKKQNVNTTVSKVNNSNNSNEQRLPLKKRHYHLSVNNDKADDEKVETKKEEKDSLEIKSDKVKGVNKQTVTSTKVDKVKSSTAPKVEVKTTTAKYVPVIKTNNTSPKLQTINNNEYDEKEEKNSVVSSTATSPVPNKVAEDKAIKIEDAPIKEEKLNSSNGSITATTPKKRHRLEMASNENVYACSKLDALSSVEDKTKISVESYINELKMKRNLIPKLAPTAEEEKKPDIVERKTLNYDSQQPPKLSPETAKKKVRKRRAYNRTGFPTVKKKKKKLPILAPENVST